MGGILFIIIATCGVIAFLVYENRQYKKSTYYQITKNPHHTVKHDKGKRGEYLIYKNLQHLENAGAKFLFNLYVPTRNDQISEIDALLLSPKGVFVFESKNYSGWIFGNEIDKYWTQTLPHGRGQSHKARFYNPIMQNAAHVRHLKNFVGAPVPTRSIIVFSDRCTLKKITARNPDTIIVNCHKLSRSMSQIYEETEDRLTPADIDDLYERLYPCTQPTLALRLQHTMNIQGR